MLHIYIYDISRLRVNTVFAAIGICLTSYVASLLADSHHNCMTNAYCCEYSIKTPDDGQLSLSETRRVLYQNKVEK